MVDTVDLSQGTTPVGVNIGLAAGEGGAVNVTAGSGGTSSTGADVTITGGVGGTTVGNGGASNIIAGSGQAAHSNGGLLTLRGGDAPISGDGGNAILKAGSSTSGGGGSTEVRGGDSNDGGGGNVTIAAGSSSDGSLQQGFGAVVSIITGNAVSDGYDAGYLHLLTGSAALNGKGGDIVFIFGTGNNARDGLFFPHLPTSDPGVPGAAWVDPVTHIVKISA